jgi:adenosylcobinamide kinase/adenosylcobinamide-phosphate guanylyltransferase
MTITTELILGGQRSGKSRRAELLAGQWLAAQPGHRAVLVATAQAGDEEMRLRILRHQTDRALRVPGMQTVEGPMGLAGAIGRYSNAQTLVVVDCLTLWLTNWLMPVQPSAASTIGETAKKSVGELLQSLASAAGPVVLVSNEIGLGVIPMGVEVREFVDALGRLNQDVATVCPRVTLMTAGLPLFLKGAP